jgi:hypothetical protein
MATIKIPSVKSTSTTHVITFTDGVVIQLTGSNTIASRKAAYEIAVKPVIIPPVEVPSTMISEITIDQLIKLKGVYGGVFKLKSGIYNDQYWITDVKNTVIDLSGCEFGVQGMPAFELKGDCSGLTFIGGLFKNINSTCISYKNTVTVRNITINGATAINVRGLFSSGGNMNESGLFGKMIGFRMLNCIIKDSPELGTALWLNAAEDFEISGNIIDNVNSNLNNHNGIFMLGGTGKVTGNRCTNHQGDLIRATPYQVESTGKILEISNNIVWNSRKYGAFEVKTDDVKEFPGFLPADVLVSNNTVGHLNTSKDWDGKLIDVYDTNSTVTVRDNLGFDLVQSRGGVITDLINYASVTDGITKVVQSGNKYFPTTDKAVTDITTFKSLHTGIGVQ